MVTKSGVDNEMYRTKGHVWWDEGESVATLRFFINPVRFDYFKRIIAALRVGGWSPRKVLDVGCGGGFLSEEFAKAGFSVTGVDPAAESVECARRHAAESGLDIEYLTGYGEKLPVGDAAFDIVLCCDVLEHVDDFEVVVREISRVLRGGGVFFYDTINRTAASYIVAIKVLQEWPATAQHEPRSHAWRQFIRPAELHAAMARAGLVHQEDRGFSARGNIVANLINLHRRVKGKISFRDLGQRLGLHESGDTSVSYMGYAVKEAEVLQGRQS